MRLNHAAVTCKNEQNADAFFVDILGLEKQKKSRLDAELTEAIFDLPCGCTFIYYSNEQMAVEVFLPDIEVDRKDDFAHLCLEVPHRETFLDQCEQAGLEVRTIAKGDKTVVFLRDFDLNLYEIKEVE